MFRQLVTRFIPIRQTHRFNRFVSSQSSDASQNQDEATLKQELKITGIHFDEIDQLMLDDVLKPYGNAFPKLDVDLSNTTQPILGSQNVVVIQPWASYANFGEDFTDPDLQLQECISLANTMNNWKVIGKKVIFTNQMNRRHIVGKNSFEALKENIYSYQGVSAVVFGVEMLSGVQLSSLEKDLKMPVYDRFTVVLNIFRQHARTKEAKIQIALAELPYIKSHLRQIHESSTYSSTAESLKLLLGGLGEKYYHQRLDILKKRENKLKYLLNQMRTHRDRKKTQRKKHDLPIVSVVGYTNSGKTSLVKYLTDDEDMTPKDQLFATLDVSSHIGPLPSTQSVIYLDTVGFISRIPILLVEAFSATLKDVLDSNLIIHLLDISHPDHRLQYSTVIKALNKLETPKNLLKTKLTIGNKADLLDPTNIPKDLPECDLNISIKNGTNMQELVKEIDTKLRKNLNHDTLVIKVSNVDDGYSWLRKNATILDCKPDEDNPNHLICRVIMSPRAKGRWTKLHGTEGVLSVDAKAV